jgi:hypothetical protein
MKVKFDQHVIVNSMNEYTLFVDAARTLGQDAARGAAEAAARDVFDQWRGPGDATELRRDHHRRRP